jgi:predicted Zn-dependent protease
MFIDTVLTNKYRVFSIRLIFTVIIFFSTYSSVSTVPLISKESELKIGVSGDKEVILQYGIYQDKALQLYVNNIGQNLIRKLSNREFRKFYFKIVDSSEINAFALPGGYVYLTRGLLAALNSEAELASVIGHEISHITLHHGAKMMVRSIGAQIISLGGAIASPKNAGKWLAISSSLFQQINMGYGRSAELDADAQGMMNSVDAGYKPFAMVKFLKNLRNQEIMSGQSYHGFQASHPDTRERIVKARLLGGSLSRKYPNTKQNQNIYLNHLKGLIYDGKKNKKDKRKYKPKYLGIYKVKKGETLTSIALKLFNDDRHALEISIINGIKENSILTPGLMLKIIKNGVYVKHKPVNQIKTHWVN